MKRFCVCAAVLAALAAGAAGKKPVQGCFYFIDDLYGVEQTFNTAFELFPFDTFRNSVTRVIAMENQIETTYSGGLNVYTPIVTVADVSYNTNKAGRIIVIAYDIRKCTEDAKRKGFAADTPKDLDIQNKNPSIDDALQVFLEGLTGLGYVLPDKIAALENKSGSLSPLEVFFIILASLSGCQAAAMFLTRNITGWGLLKSPERYWVNLYKKYF